MEKLSRFTLENDEFEIHPLGQVEAQISDKLAGELMELLSNDDSLGDCPELKIASRKEIDSTIQEWEEGFQKGSRYSFFIYWKTKDTLIGEILLLPPQTVKEQFNLEGVWMLQYVLNKRYRDHGIMTSMLSLLLDHLKGKIEKLCALCDPENIPAIRVLENLSFRRIDKEGVEKEYYELSL